MKKLNLILILSCLLISLASAEKESMREVDISYLIQMGGVLFEEGNSKPFSGYGVKHFENGQMQSRIPFKDGMAHGLSEYWNDKGQKTAEITLVDGVPSGLMKQWDQEGNIIVDRKLE